MQVTYYSYNDAGRAQSKRPKQSNDCTVRAIALAFDISYDEAYETLAAAGRVCGQRFDFRQWANSQPRLRWVPFQAVKGQRRMNPVTFSECFPNGRYIVKTAKHVACVKQGIFYDELKERPDRCIYGAWEVL